jgi:hypothetical protein
MLNVYIYKAICIIIYYTSKLIPVQSSVQAVSCRRNRVRLLSLEDFFWMKRLAVHGKLNLLCLYVSLSALKYHINHILYSLYMKSNVNFIETQNAGGLCML